MKNRKRMSRYTREEIEKRLKDALHEALRSFNQEDGMVSLHLDEDGSTCTVKLGVVIVEEDDYVGFSGY